MTPWTNYVWLSAESVRLQEANTLEAMQYDSGNSLCGAVGDAVVFCSDKSEQRVDK